MRAYIVSEEDSVIFVVIHRVHPRVAHKMNPPCSWKILKSEALQIKLRMVIVLHYHSPWNTLPLLPLECHTETRLSCDY